MRITDPISKSGYFWLPSNSDHKIPGTITISNGGKIEIETIGHLRNSPTQLAQILASSNQGEARVHGHIHEFGDITVDDCIYTNQTLSALGETKLTATHAYLGALISKSEPPLFDSIEFSFDGLNEWARRAALSQTRSEDLTEISITFKKPTNIDLSIGDGVTLHIVYDCLSSGSPGTRTLKSTTALRLSFEEPTEISDAIRLLHRIQNFFSFAMDETTHLLYINGRQESHKTQPPDNKTILKPIKIFHYGVYDPGTESPSIFAPNMLFHLGLVKETLEENIKKWLHYYEVITPTLNLYFSQKSGAFRFLNGRFLALAQAIETLHRNTSDEKFMDNGEFREIRKFLVNNCPKNFKKKLEGMLINGNELSLHERLERVIYPHSKYFGSNEKIETLIKAIKDNRNYLTHYSSSLEKKMLDGQELLDVCLKIEAILQIKFMELIGFDENLLDQIIERSHTIANKLRFNQADD